MWSSLKLRNLPAKYYLWSFWRRSEVVLTLSSGDTLPMSPEPVRSGVSRTVDGREPVFNNQVSYITCGAHTGHGTWTGHFQQPWDNWTFDLWPYHRVGEHLSVQLPWGCTGHHDVVNNPPPPPMFQSTVLVNTVKICVVLYCKLPLWWKGGFPLFLL